MKTKLFLCVLLSSVYTVSFMEPIKNQFYRFTQRQNIERLSDHALGRGATVYIKQNPMKAAIGAYLILNVLLHGRDSIAAHGLHATAYKAPIQILTDVKSTMGLSLDITRSVISHLVPKFINQP